MLFPELLGLLRMLWIIQQNFCKTTKKLVGILKICYEKANFNRRIGDFPGDPVVRMLCFHSRRQGYDPWLGNLRSHSCTMGQKNFFFKGTNSRSGNLFCSEGICQFHHMNLNFENLLGWRDRNQSTEFAQNSGVRLAIPLNNLRPPIE